MSAEGLIKPQRWSALLGRAENPRLGQRPLTRPLIRSWRRPRPGSEERCSGTDSTRRTGKISAKRPTRSVIKPGEEIHLGAGQRFSVIDVVPFEEQDASPFVGLLQVEAA